MTDSDFQTKKNESRYLACYEKRDSEEFLRLTLRGWLLISLSSLILR